MAKSKSDSIPNASSLRKSLIGKELQLQMLENDDEAERLLLRQDTLINNASISSTPSSKRHSLGLSSLLKVPEFQMKEHMALCMKLNTENKINVKNAFSLEMIDFMAFMVTTRKTEINDLQSASAALDVSTKIYGYRVDSLYTEILKMAGGFDKQQKMVESTGEEPEVHENGEGNDERQLKDQGKKRRRKNKQTIFSTENALKGSIETSFPSLHIIGSGDLCTSDMLYQAILPNHANSGFCHHPYNDIILDVLNTTEEKDKNFLNCTIPAIEDCSNLDICSSFSTFGFFNWSQESDSQDQQLSQEDDQNKFQFDLDASIPAMDEHEPGPMDYFDIQDDEENINLCTRKSEQVERIVDLHDIVASQIPQLDKPSEYSFVHKNFTHWAGPSYWKIKILGKVIGNTKIVETCHQTAFTKKKEIQLNYTDDLKSTIEENFKPVQAAKIQFKANPKSWKEEKTTLPEDIHYDDSYLNQLYLCSLVYSISNKNGEQLDVTQLSEDEDYDYNNEKDISDYCPNVPSNDHEGEDNFEELRTEDNFEELRTEDDCMLKTREAFTGDNLVAAPTLTQKVFLQYSICAKKIDMRQLKKTIWRSLTTPSNEEENTVKEVQTENTREIKESKPFSIVYKTLPNVLSKTNLEALSLPIAFVSLLHLANEKSLKLNSLSDLSDIIVEKD